MQLSFDLQTEQPKPKFILLAETKGYQIWAKRNGETEATYTEADSLEELREVMELEFPKEDGWMHHEYREI